MLLVLSNRQQKSCSNVFDDISLGDVNNFRCWKIGSNKSSSGWIYCPISTFNSNSGNNNSSKNGRSYMGSFLSTNSTNFSITNRIESSRNFSKDFNNSKEFIFFYSNYNRNNDNSNNIPDYLHLYAMAIGY